MYAKLPVQKQRVREDLLGAASERLRIALAESAPGRERQWAEKVSAAFVDLERGLRQHMAVAETPGGTFAEVDEERPTLARQVDELRREHDSFLDQVIKLRGETAGIADAFDPARAVKAGPLTIPNISAFREQVEKLLTDLEENKGAETKLVFESINTDIGGGD